MFEVLSDFGNTLVEVVHCLNHFEKIVFLYSFVDLPRPMPLVKLFSLDLRVPLLVTVESFVVVELDLVLAREGRFKLGGSHQYPSQRYRLYRVQQWHVGHKGVVAHCVGHLDQVFNLAFANNRLIHYIGVPHGVVMIAKEALI